MHRAHAVLASFLVAICAACSPARAQTFIQSAKKGLDLDKYKYSTQSSGANAVKCFVGPYGWRAPAPSPGRVARPGRGRRAAARMCDPSDVDQDTVWYTPGPPAVSNFVSSGFPQCVDVCSDVRPPPGAPPAPAARPRRAALSPLCAAELHIAAHLPGCVPQLQVQRDRVRSAGRAADAADVRVLR